MLKNIVNLSCVILLLSSCVSGPNEYLKKSANNKYFDTGGFKNNKRAPLYNSKYINQAKRNIQQDHYYDDEEFDDDADYIENETHSARYKNMNAYRDLAKQEAQNSRRHRNNSYPNLYDSKKHLPSTYDNYKNLELKEEIDEIKYMLEETKKELENRKCPTEQKIERSANRSTNINYIKSL
ncbi:MAG: hypothetical protein H6909_01990 [Rickettsiaceae bacterium]|nr:hypothetical protein [Rickettsiaceae bacterium]